MDGAQTMHQKNIIAAEREMIKKAKEAGKKGDLGKVLETLRKYHTGVTVNTTYKVIVWSHEAGKHIEVFQVTSSRLIPD